jgi:type I restriction enzyme S subunit
MITDLKPYREYKESGLPWLGQVPGHWVIKRGKSYLMTVDQRSQAGKEELLTVSSARGVVPRRTANVTMFKAESYAGHKLCWPGDLVINSLWAWGGGLGVSNHHGIISTAYSVYRARPSAGINPRYLHELVRSAAFHWELQVRSKGVWISRLQLTDTAFLDSPIPLPPPAEQAAIVRFLDWANGRLERAIRAKRKVIALLNEQKQAIIHRAVTRGLDPSVPLKPSGIPWLGDIPKHWEVRRLKSLGTKFGSGVTPRGGASVYQDAGVPLLRSQNIHFGELRLAKVARISPRVHAAMAGTHVRPRDVLLNITGASIGRVCAVPEELREANVNQHVCIIRPIGVRCDSEYLAMYLATEAAQTAIYIAQNGSSREGLAVTDVKALPIVLPTVREQRMIGESVHRDTQDVRTAISRLEREITLLREYRTRLVADVVTGKLDVRAAAASLLDEAPLDDATASRDPDDDALDTDDLTDTEADA